MSAALTSATEPQAAGMPHGRLREPAHRVSPRAVRYWTVNSLIGGVVTWGVLFAVAWFLPEGRWWSTALVWLFVVVMVVIVILFGMHIDLDIFPAILIITSSASFCCRRIMPREPPISPTPIMATCLK